ncbi:MAG: hypothetical protein P4L65_02555 [Legionella sp.]|nr:hypothetical protein [Legionella sp.]
MKLLTTSLCLLIGLLFSLCAAAADIPQDDIGAQKYDTQQCIDNTSQSCINSACLNSDQIDCQDNCRKMAQEKCQQETNE